MTRLQSWRFWWGTPQGALVYFGVLVPIVVGLIVLVVTWIAVPPVPAG